MSMANTHLVVEAHPPEDVPQMRRGLAWLSLPTSADMSTLPRVSCHHSYLHTHLSKQRDNHFPNRHDDIDF
eukprot:3576435-Rhodomonas_salina.1